MYTILLRKHGKQVLLLWDAVCNKSVAYIRCNIGIASLSLWMLGVDCQLQAFEFSCWLCIKSEVFLDFSESLVRFACRLEDPVTWSTYLQQQNSLWVCSAGSACIKYGFVRIAFYALATKFHSETVYTFLLLCTLVARGLPIINRIIQSKTVDEQRVLICLNT